jgi:type II secretion system protein I
MTWLTGNKKSFTLVEVMVALAILSSGLVAVYQGLLGLMDAIESLSNRLQAECLIDNKIWEIENDIKSPATSKEKEAGTGILAKAKGLEWQTSALPLKEAGSLGEIKIVLSWQEKGRQAAVSRNAYLKK